MTELLPHEQGETLAIFSQYLASYVFFSFMKAGQEITWKKFGTKATFSRADTGHTKPGYSDTERKKAGTDAPFWSINVFVFSTSTLPEPVEISTLNCCGYFCYVFVVAVIDR